MKKEFCLFANEKPNSLSLFSKENSKDGLDDSEISIFAELSVSQFNKLNNDEYGIVIPRGATMTHKSGSKRLNFVCEGREIADMVQDALTEDGISWQEM